METRIALLSVVIDNPDSVEPFNRLLHEYKDFVVGRMGIPYRQKGLNLISIVLDAPADAINTLSGKAGQLPGVTAKAVYAKLPEEKA